MNNEPRSEAQAKFIATLLDQRLTTFGFTNVDEAVQGIGVPNMSKFDASVLIGRLKATPADPQPGVPYVVAASTKHGINSRSSRCETCGHTVEAGAGFYYALPNGKGWAVHHKVDECNTKPAPTMTNPEKGVFYKCAGNAFVQVYETGNQRLAGKLMSATGNFNYERGSLDRVRAGGVVVTVNEVANEQCMRQFGCPLGSEELRVKAAQFGRDHGNCIFCSKDLTDERSDPGKGGVGYGPKCAVKYGLPWGEVK